MTGSIRIFEKLNFTPKLSALAFLKVKLPNMTDWHTAQVFVVNEIRDKTFFVIFYCQCFFKFLSFDPCNGGSQNILRGCES